MRLLCYFCGCVVTTGRLNVALLDVMARLITQIRVAQMHADLKGWYSRLEQPTGGTFVTAGPENLKIDMRSLKSSLALLLPERDPDGIVHQISRTINSRR